MADESKWREFFNQHAPIYLQNAFTRNTVAEADFIIAELGLTPGQAILDIGCGVGRHSIELSRRGFAMTGVDLSPGMLSEARQAAAAEGLEIEFILSDAAEFSASKKYDAAICLCEGAFCLLGAADDPVERDLKILRNINAALKPGGGFILTALSALRHIRHYSKEEMDKGIFDPLTLVETCEMEFDTPEGKKSVQARERGYVATELELMHKISGFEVIGVYGGTAGNWGHRGLDPDEYELMVVSRKAG